MKTEIFSVPAARRIAMLFAVAVTLNYPWELAQSPLFASEGERGTVWWHCFLASLGDGVLLSVIYVVGRTLTGRPNWFERPGWPQYALMLTIGGVVAIIIEWVAVHLIHRWAYKADMPLVPGLNIGVVPVLQMLVLPPIIFYLVTKWSHRLES